MDDVVLVKGISLLLKGTGPAVSIRTVHGFLDGSRQLVVVVGGGDVGTEVRMVKEKRVSVVVEVVGNNNGSGSSSGGSRVSRVSRVSKISSRSSGFVVVKVVKLVVLRWYSCILPFTSSTGNNFDVDGLDDSVGVRAVDLVRE